MHELSSFGLQDTRERAFFAGMSILYQRPYRFGHGYDIFRIPVYRFGFTAILYIYIYIYVCMYVSVYIYIIINIKVSIKHFLNSELIIHGFRL